MKNLSTNMKYSIAVILYFVVMFLVIALFNGCKPSLETCNRLYPPQVNTVVKDSISYKKEFVQLPGDTSYIILPFDCVEDSLKRVIELYRGKVGNYETSISWFNGQLKMTQKRFADSLAVWNKYSQKVQEKIVEKPVDRIVKEAPKWSWWSLMFNILFIVIVILWFKFKK